MVGPLPQPQDVPLQALPDPWLASKGIRLSIKREVLIHPYISGNKWRKLRYVVADAVLQGATTLLTFGGAYSNHLLATAAAAQACKLESIGIVRGEPHEPLNPILAQSKALGMHLHYIDRSTYRLKHAPSALASLLAQFGQPYHIPEGGSCALALPGCAELLEDLSGISYDYLATACGTGGTLAGLIAGTQGRGQLLGFPVLKGGGFLAADIKQLLHASGYLDGGNWRLVLDYHLGGYAKRPRMLLDFMRHFSEVNGIFLDFVYTGKLLYGLYDLIAQGHFPPGTHIIALHTGGMMGMSTIQPT